MGRPRKRNKHLPMRMQFRHGSYYYVICGRWMQLGRDYGAALRKWADLQGAETKPGQTVADAIAHYMQGMAPLLAARTREGYEHSAKRLGPVFGHVLLMDLRPEHVTRYLRGSDAKVAANRDKALLSAAYNYVNAEGWLDLAGYNPARVKRNVEIPRNRYVTHDELAALLAKAQPKIAAMIELAYLTGMRRGDLVKIRMVDLADAGILVTASKTGKVQTITWTPDLQRVIDAAKATRRKAISPWLFPSRLDLGKHMTGRGLLTELAKVATKASVLDVTWHDLRRKSGSDTTLEHATALLDHSNPSTTKRAYRAAPNVVRPIR